MAAAMTYATFPHSDIMFKPPTQNSHGSNTVYIQQNGQWAGPRLQLFDQEDGQPPVTPFGININEQNGGKSVSINVRSPRLRAFLEGVDNRVLEEAVKKSSAWLGKDYDKDTISMFQRKLMSPAKDGYDPLLRIKIVEWGNERKDTKVWKQRKTADGQTEVVRGVVDDIKPQSAIIPIVMLNNLWFIQNSFGMSLHATDILVVSSPDSEDNAFNMHVPVPLTAAPPAEGEEPIEIMAAPTVTMYNEFDVGALAYQPPTKNPHGSITVWLNHPDRKMQLPPSEVPFGLNISEDDPSRKSFSISVTQDDVKAMCAAVDKKNIDSAVENSAAWWGKAVPHATVEAFYRPSIAVPAKESHAWLLRLKVSPKTRFWKVGPGSTLLRAAVEDIQPHCVVIPVVETSCLWFVQNSFGITFRAVDVLITTEGSADGMAAPSGDFIMTDAPGAAAAPPPAAPPAAAED